MVSKKDIFHQCGPFHLTYVNWEHEYHRQSVAASLVNGVYVLEKDRQKRRNGRDALALPWWTFFQFQLLQTLVDDDDNSIFGAIYEFKPPPSMFNDALHSGPRYVIAFRGTILKLKTFYRDIKLDFKIFRHKFHQNLRSEKAIKAVREMVASAGVNGSNIWLAGHSLGSGMALLAAKTMAAEGVFIESFLFNPPFPSFPFEIIKSNKLKNMIRIGSSVATTVAAVAINSNERSSSFDSFAALSSWIPQLFVNPSDYICSEYVGYFEHRTCMEEIGAGRIERIATQNSLSSLMRNTLGKESEPLHLIPSATLTVNSTPKMNCIKAHGIDQWWTPQLPFKSKSKLYTC